MHTTSGIYSFPLWNLSLNDMLSLELHGIGLAVNYVFFLFWAHSILNVNVGKGHIFDVYLLFSFFVKSFSFFHQGLLLSTKLVEKVDTLRAFSFPPGSYMLVASLNEDVWDPRVFLRTASKFPHQEYEPKQLANC